MWTKTKSLTLSRILAAAMTGMTMITTFFVPSMCRWYENVSVGSGFFGDSGIFLPMCICLYICECLALTAMWGLHVLLRNISRGDVFTERNTLCLRIISWACMMAGVVFAVFGMWRFIFFLPAFFAVMFGLIMRVLKNVFEKAVEIKSENDFTI
ncbi:MAG: DUF2975 domain-containing protein [Oscillospiraceae bacterium]|nr:DUF2975 domain-containing protein [Oscillospiraceae bacterium]